MQPRCTRSKQFKPLPVSWSSEKGEYINGETSHLKCYNLKRPFTLSCVSHVQLRLFIKSLQWLYNMHVNSGIIGLNHIPSLRCFLLSLLCLSHNNVSPIQFPSIHHFQCFSCFFRCDIGHKSKPLAPAL